MTYSYGPEPMRIIDRGPVEYDILDATGKKVGTYGFRVGELVPLTENEEGR